MTLPEPGRSPVRRALDVLPRSDPAEPGSAIAARLRLDRVVSLGLNEGQWGPFPAALEALDRLAPSLNRYPTRGSTELASALAERLGVALENVIVTAGADAAIGYACQAMVDPDDDVVVPWPSFPSFARDTEKRGARPILVPLTAGRIDVDAVAEAVTPRTKLTFVATPNNPTGTALSVDELERLLSGLPGHVLPVVDEAYFDFGDPATRPDALAISSRLGRPALVLRTFSKLYGLAGLRVAFAVGPASVIDAMRRVQRGYDVSAPGQVAALASLGDETEVLDRRTETRAAVDRLVDLLTELGLPPHPEPRGNFVFVEVGPNAEVLAGQLVEQGVIVQPTTPFGAPDGIRITAGAPDELDALARALRAVLGEVRDP